MKNKTKTLLILLLITNLSAGYAQQNMVCKGKITDVGTHDPLKDVNIYRVSNGDTTLFKSNAAGEFQIPLQTGARLLLKKTGYAWQIVRIYNNDIQHIKMSRSKPSMNPTIFADEKVVENIVVTFDGQPVPQSEIDDALSIDFNDINFGIRKTKDGSTEFYMITK